MRKIKKGDICYTSAAEWLALTDETEARAVVVCTFSTGYSRWIGESIMIRSAEHPFIGFGYHPKNYNATSSQFKEGDLVWVICMPIIFPTEKGIRCRIVNDPYTNKLHAFGQFQDGSIYYMNIDGLDETTFISHYIGQDIEEDLNFVDYLLKAKNEFLNSFVITKETKESVDDFLVAYDQAIEKIREQEVKV